MAHRKRNRTSGGCLICKQRKKKCDRVRPTCGGCKRNFIECVWAEDVKDGNETGPKEGGSHDGCSVKFSIINQELKHKIKYKRSDKLQMEVYVKRGLDRLYMYDGEKMLCIPKFPTDLPTVPKDKESSFIKYHKQNSGAGEPWDNIASLDLELKDFPFVDVPEGLAIPPYELETPNEDEEKQYLEIMRQYRNNGAVEDSVFKNLNMEAFMFYTCLTGFLPKLGTQHTPEALSIDAAFTPFVSFNPIMRHVFLCCGATFLAWKDYQRFQKYSDEYFESSKNILEEYMATNPNYRDEDWVFVSIQLLCVRVKNSMSGNVDIAFKLLSYSYDIISHRYLKLHTITLPERMFLESFIYHYSTSILWAKDISGLPCPFEIFKDLNKALSCPMYNNEKGVKWMSNPILGSCLDTFEIIAKLSYISRQPMPLSQSFLVKLVQLRNWCIRYKHRMPDEPLSDIDWFNYRINCMVGLLTAKVCYLFASKMIDYEVFDPHSTSVMDCTREIVQHYKEIPSKHPIWGMLSWTMVISGVFYTEREDQEFILRRIDEMAETAHSYAGVKMKKFLHEVWDDGATKNNVNYLFDRNRLCQVDM